VEVKEDSGMENENGIPAGEPSGRRGTALVGLLAGSAAVIWWVTAGAWGGEAMVIPPLAGALIGWGVWRLDREDECERPQAVIPVRVRRLPPDLPREFS